MEQLLSEGEAFPDGPDVLKEAGNGRTKAISLSVLEEKEVLKSYFLSPDEAGTVPGAVLQEEERTRISSPSQILQPLSKWDTELFEKQISGVYPFEMLTAMPAKMTVSEIKRQVGDYARQEEEGEEGAALLPAAASAKRPVNLVPQPIEAQRERKKLTMSPAEKGTLLHSVFQYLDFPSIREDKDAQRIEKAMGNLAAHNMIHAGMQTELENYYPAIDRFVASDLCGRLISAEKQKGRGPFREIPFSITMPAGETDVSLVQGMIDCWFIEDGSAVLIDYKSDTIAGTQTDKARILDARYSVQLGYYAKAIEAASGLKVKERIIWLIPDGLSFSIEAPGKTL